MFDRAHDGFTQTLHAVPWALGALGAVLIVALVVAAVVLLLDTALGTLQNTTRTLRIRRAWRRSGRTPSR